MIIGLGPTAGNYLPSSGGTITGHLSFTGTAPTVVASSGLGLGPPTPTIVGNDNRGLIQFGTGTLAALGVLFTVTFNSAWGTTPTVVVEPVGNNFLSVIGMFNTINVTTTSFQINATGLLFASSQTAGTYGVFYHVLG